MEVAQRQQLAVVALSNRGLLRAAACNGYAELHDGVTSYTELHIVLCSYNLHSVVTLCSIFSTHLQVNRSGKERRGKKGEKRERTRERGSERGKRVDRENKTKP